MAALNTAPQGESCESRPLEAQDSLTSHSGVNGSFAEAAAPVTGSAAPINESESIEAKEFVAITTYPGPRGVIFIHYDEQDPNTQVQEHFAKSLNLPRMYSVLQEQELKKTAEPVPMSQRTFPASFWNPFAPDESPLCGQQTPPPPPSTSQSAQQDRTNKIQNSSNRYSSYNPRPPRVCPDPLRRLKRTYSTPGPSGCHAHELRVPGQLKCEHQHVVLIPEREELLVEYSPAAGSPGCDAHSHEPPVPDQSTSDNQAEGEETLVDADCSSFEQCKSCGGAIIALKSGGSSNFLARAT